MKIFISIASYRDPDLPATLADCVAKARYPLELRFGICWQHGDEEPSFPMLKDARVRLIDCDWRQSQGACWARAEIMQLWNGEDYFLQIDSHHRFAQDWDVKLIYYAQATHSPKPLLTAYCPAYDPGGASLSSSNPTQMDLDYFTEEGIPLFKANENPQLSTLGRPLRARFVSGHFLFTLGGFAREVPYDPDLYFHGEEITLAVRAYTWGYDLFHPPEPLLWHEYSREYRRKHWDDHVEGTSVRLPWHARDSRSKQAVIHFFQRPFIGPFGCGPIRSFAAYEAYAGLDLKRKRVQAYTLEGREPPDPHAPGAWCDGARNWSVRIELKRSQLSSGALTSSGFWYVGLHDRDGSEIVRDDLSGPDLTRVAGDVADRIVIEREFVSNRTPRTWTVWPCSKDGTWLAKIEGVVPA